MSLSLTTLLLAALAPAAEHRAAASIYGQVELRDGTSVTGALRWEEEESLWLHHFNGTRVAAFDLDSLPSAVREAVTDSLPGRQIRLGDHTIELRKMFGRQELQPQDIAVEFGAIERLAIDDDRVTVVLRDGGTIELDGGSNDIGADIEIIDDAGKTDELDWDDITEIRFASAPSEHPLFEPHLFADVIGRQGTFSGTVAWDRDESYPSQILDVEVDDNDLEIPFSEITALARGDNATAVTTKDGQARTLSGSNDVDDSNRGLMIHVPGLGLVELDWEDFESLTFGELPVGELPDRTSWAAVGPLRGRLGNTAPTELVYDLNLDHGALGLEGKLDDLEYTIPLHEIASLSAIADQPDAVSVRTISGHELQLTGTSQLSGLHFGWLTGNPPQRIEWTAFKRADLGSASSSTAISAGN